MVHIMTPQMRNFYKLEKKWQDGEVSTCCTCCTYCTCTRLFLISIVLLCAPLTD